VQSLSNFTSAEEFHEWALQDGLAKQLVAMLGDTRLSAALREDAARSLKNIALDDDIRTAMADHGAIETLANACLAAQPPGGKGSRAGSGAAGGAAGGAGGGVREGVRAGVGEGGTSGEASPDRHIRLREQAARGLGNLAVCDVLEKRIVASPAVPALIGLLAEGDEAASDAALGSLANLVGNEQMRVQFVGGGGIELLRGPINGDNDELCKHAGWTLASLAVDPALSDDVVAKGGLPLLIRYAQSPNPVYQVKGRTHSPPKAQPSFRCPRWINIHVRSHRGFLPLLIRYAQSPNPVYQVKGQTHGSSNTHTMHVMRRHPESPHKC
jgi:hypothetical protein